MMQEKEQSIAQLKHSLQDKEQQLQVFNTTQSEPSECMKSTQAWSFDLLMFFSVGVFGDAGIIKKFQTKRCLAGEVKTAS